MSIASLDRVSSAVADPTRRAILDRLAQGPARAGELAAPFAIFQLFEPGQQIPISSHKRN